MAKRLDPDSEFLLFFSDLLNSFDKSPFNPEPELHKFLSRVETILGGNLLQLRPLDLRTFLVKEVTLLFGFISFLADETEFLAFLVYAN
jgi:hypothetical protein